MLGYFSFISGIFLIYSFKYSVQLFWFFSSRTTVIYTCSLVPLSSITIHFLSGTLISFLAHISLFLKNFLMPLLNFYLSMSLLVPCNLILILYAFVLSFIHFLNLINSHFISSCSSVCFCSLLLYF